MDDSKNYIHFIHSVSKISTSISFRFCYDLMNKRRIKDYFNLLICYEQHRQKKRKHKEKKSCNLMDDYSLIL